LIAVYNEIIKECREDERSGSATSYESSMKALLKFDPHISFRLLTPRFLRDFQDYFLKMGNSLTSVGIYLRQLRAVYNRAIADKIISQEEYPFTQYNIPGGYNKKKALTNNEIKKILNYEPSNSLEERALDFWKLSYLCNGINIGDLLKLKKQNIDNEFIIFKRSKTLRTKKEPKIISIALLPETKALIEKHKNGKYRNSQDYIFPVLKPGLSDEEQKSLIANFNRSNNQQLDKICKRLEIAGKLSNMTARHSFATVLKRKDANPLLISDLLGHSSLKTTESYLGSFMNEQLVNTSKMLLDLDE